MGISFLPCSLLLLSATLYDRSDAYRCGQSSISRSMFRLRSTVSTAVDNLAEEVLKSSKDVKNLKFEPIFGSFAQNEYFVSGKSCSDNARINHNFLSLIAESDNNLSYHSCKRSGRKSLTMSAHLFLALRDRIR